MTDALLRLDSNWHISCYVYASSVLKTYLVLLYSAACDTQVAAESVKRNCHQNSRSIVLVCI